MSEAAICEWEDVGTQGSRCEARGSHGGGWEDRCRENQQGDKDMER